MGAPSSAPWLLRRSTQRWSPSRRHSRRKDWTEVLPHTPEAPAPQRRYHAVLVGLQKAGTAGMGWRGAGRAVRRQGPSGGLPGIGTCGPTLSRGLHVFAAVQSSDTLGFCRQRAATVRSASLICHQPVPLACSRGTDRDASGSLFLLRHLGHSFLLRKRLLIGP
eukprot:351652-Chlamydomonas_euryale.AAC.15